MRKPGQRCSLGVVRTCECPYPVDYTSKPPRKEPGLTLAEVLFGY